MNKKNVVVAGAHDFNTWNQLFTIFARDYLWQPRAFVNSAPVFDAGGEAQSVDENRNLTFSVSATDPDGDALTYSAANLLGGCDVSTLPRRSSRGRRTTRESGTYTVTFTASDGTHWYNLSGTKRCDHHSPRCHGGPSSCPVSEAAVAALGVNGGVKNALTVKLDNVAKQLAKGQTDAAVSLLTVDFIGQVQSLLAEGKLTQAQADALTLAAQETVQNITS